jgi:hypothetical protein
MALLLVHTIWSSLQHALSLLSFPCLHLSFCNGFYHSFMSLLAAVYLTAAPELNTLSSNHSTFNSPQLHSTALNELNSVGRLIQPWDGPNFSPTVACHRRHYVFLCYTCMGHNLARGLHVTILKRKLITSAFVKCGLKGTGMYTGHATIM